MRTLLIIICIVQFFSNVSWAQGQENERPFHIGLAYPISSNGRDANEIKNNVSLQILTGNSAGIHGLELCGIGSFVNGDAKSVQGSGIINMVSGSMYGVQAAGTTNITMGEVRGVQASGTINMAGSFKGLQGAGIVNISKGESQGLQGAGSVNIADTIVGMQGSGFLNMATEINGVQGSGFINIANKVKGFQGAGFINIAREVNGVQAAGFINIADSCDYPLGLVNIVRKGKMTLNMWTNLQNDINVTFKSGGRKTYGIIGFGVNPFESELESNIHLGIGYRMKMNQTLDLNLELVDAFYVNESERKNYSDDEYNFGNSDEENSIISLNLIADFQPIKRFGITLGPSLNYMYTSNQKRANVIKDQLWEKNDVADSEFQKIWIGFTGGVYYRF